MGANDKGDADPDPIAARVQNVQDENVRVANNTMPGRRAALPPGAASRLRIQPQADENRDQPLAPDGARRGPDKPAGTG